LEPGKGSPKLRLGEKSKLLSRFQSRLSRRYRRFLGG
jgi:hypothetical protein